MGDSLTIRYNIAAAVRIEPASKNGIRELIESSTVQQSNPDEMPGIEAERRVEVLAIIQTINRKAGTVTLRGATRVVTVAVPEGINMAKLKVGDEVHAVFTDATMIDVEGKQS